MGFTGHWKQQGMIKVPVIPDDYETFDLFDFEPQLPTRMVTPVDHVPSHSGYNLHNRRGEEPCEECKTAERMYQHNRRNPE
jgi:hypothetical protein